LNLTAPQDAPLEYDPRAWVPTIQAPASVSTLPSAHLQILPNTSAIVIEAGANSTGLVHISADRSALHSEAVVALCINTASPNVTDTPSLTTAYPVPNTSLFVFGLISVIFPATAPIGDNSYLFDGPGINATFAQYFNQSSYLNDGYNVLFTTFNLTMTYIGLPSGVEPSELILVDLVSGNVVNSSEVDSSRSSVSAGWLTGYPGVWGGGGIYAIGFEASLPNTTFVGSGETASRFNLLNLILVTGLIGLGSVML
jgi:hypothetical protein